MTKYDPKGRKSEKWLSTGKGRAIALISGLVIVAGIAAADSRPGQHLRLLVAEGGVGEVLPTQFKSGHGFSPRRGSPFADMSDEEIDALIARAVAHAAIEIDASDEQRNEITTLVTQLAGQLRTVPEGFRDAGERFQTLLLADEVDAAALEAVRAERLAEADRVIFPRFGGRPDRVEETRRGVSDGGTEAAGVPGCVQARGGGACPSRSRRVCRTKALTVRECQIFCV